MAAGRASRTVLLVLLLSLLLLPLGSGEVVKVPLVCPLCGAPFDGAQAVPPARSAGSDSDFCDYSAGGSTRAFDVQVCTSCGYTDKLAFFLSGESLPPAAKRDLPARLKDLWNGKPPANQQAAPIARKFEAALVCAAARGVPAAELAALAHLGAWAVRDKITFRALQPCYRMPLDAFKAFGEEYRALELDSPAAFSTAFRLLQLTVRLGLPATRAKLAALISSTAPRFFSEQDTAKLRAELDAFERDAADEAALLAEAASRFQEALSVPGLDPRKRLLYTYLVGELERRCGEAEDARKWLKAADAEGQRPDIRKLIPVLLAHCEEAGRPESSFSRFPETVCPLCGRKTPYLPPAEPDYMGGSDCDFCTYSLDPTAYATDLVTCLNCRYTRFASEFDKPLSDEAKKKLRAALSALGKTPKPSSPRAVPCWKKYEYAAVCLAALDSPPSKVAMAWVNAAWAARRTCCAPTLETELPQGPLMPKAARKAASKLGGGDFGDAFLAALLCHRAGLLKLRRRYMKRAAKLAEDLDEREALLKSTERLFALERDYLKRAVPLLEKVESGGRDYEFYRFLLGEALRRTGESRKARKVLRECLDFPRVGKAAGEILSGM